MKLFRSGQRSWLCQVTEEFWKKLSRMLKPRAPTAGTGVVQKVVAQAQRVVGAGLVVEARAVVVPEGVADHTGRDLVAVVPQAREIVGHDVVPKRRHSPALELARAEGLALDVASAVRDDVLPVRAAIDHQAVLEDVARPRAAHAARTVVAVAPPHRAQGPVQAHPAVEHVVAVAVLDQVAVAPDDGVVAPGELELLDGPVAVFRVDAEGDEIAGQLELVPFGAFAAQVEHERAVGCPVRRPPGIGVQRRGVLDLGDNGLAVQDDRDILGLVGEQLHGPALGLLDGLPLLGRWDVVKDRAYADAIIFPCRQHDRRIGAAAAFGLDRLLVEAFLDPDRVAGLDPVHRRLDRREGRRLGTGILVGSGGVLLGHEDFAGSGNTGQDQKPQPPLSTISGSLSREAPFVCWRSVRQIDLPQFAAGDELGVHQVDRRHVDVAEVVADRSGQHERFAVGRQTRAGCSWSRMLPGPSKSIHPTAAAPLGEIRRSNSRLLTLGNAWKGVPENMSARDWGPWTAA